MKFQEKHRHSDDLPVVKLSKMPHCGIAHESRRSNDEHFPLVHTFSFFVPVSVTPVFPYASFPCIGKSRGHERDMPLLLTTAAGRQQAASTLAQLSTNASVGAREDPCHDGGSGSVRYPTQDSRMKICSSMTYRDASLPALSSLKHHAIS